MDKTLTYKIEIEIDYTQIPVIVSYHWDNDGIGSYEFWGQKCFDAGTNYIKIDDIVPEYAEDITPDNNRYIEENFERLCEELSERIESTYDCFCDDDPA